MVLGSALSDYFESIKDAREQATHKEEEERNQALADTPILTGDPEFDAWELEETSTERTFNVTRGGTRGGDSTQHDD